MLDCSGVVSGQLVRDHGQCLGVRKTAAVNDCMATDVGMSLNLTQSIRISVFRLFCMQMTALIGERESKVTQALTTIGMLRSSYWLSWIVWEIVLAVFVTLISMAFGAAVQIDFFLKNSFGVVFFTLFLFQLAMVGFAYFLASFIRKSSLAISLGFVIFLVGFVFSVRFRLAGSHPFPCWRKVYGRNSNS